MRFFYNKNIFLFELNTSNKHINETMNPKEIFAKYNITNEYIQSIENGTTSVEQFIDSITPAWYALRLQGKTLQDIQSTDTVRALFPFASALLVPEYMHKKKHILKQEIIEKFNSIFHSTETVTNEATDAQNIQSALVIGPPCDYDNQLPDLSLCTEKRPIEFQYNKDGYRVPTESTILQFFMYTCEYLYCHVYRHLKYYKHRYYQYKETGTTSPWTLIVSLDDPVLDLYGIIGNSVDSSSDHGRMLSFLDDNDKIKLRVQKCMVKYMEKKVRTFSELAPYEEKKEDDDNDSKNV